MDRAERALNYFGNNFNCSQAVFTAFATDYGFDEKTALKIGTNLGGGARSGELCGAVSGALMALGLICGHSESSDNEGKVRSYALSEEFVRRFTEANGSVVCRELLDYDLSKPEQMAVIKEKNLFRTVCPKMVESAVRILEEMLAEQKN